MGFFSWETADTNKSISNNYSSRGALPVYLLLPGNKALFEPSYNGYGVFDGIDVYVWLYFANKTDGGVVDLDLLRELEGDELQAVRIKGIRLGFSDQENKFSIKLVEDESLLYTNVKASEICPKQGFFYD